MAVEHRAVLDSPVTREAAVTRVHLAVLAALCLALNLHGIGWGLPNPGHDWTPDSVAPMGPLAYAKRLLDGEPWLSKYPPTHFMVLAAAYAPYVAYLRLTGGMTTPTDTYPHGLTDPAASLAVFTVIARLVSVAMGTGLVLVCYFTVRTLHGRLAALVAGLLVATSYPIVHYAHNANIDVPHLFWAFLAVWSFVSLLERPRAGLYVLFGAFMALALGTKTSIYGLFAGLLVVGAAVHVAWWHRARPGDGARRRLAAHVGIGALAFGVAAVVAFNLLLDWPGFLHYVDLHLHRSVKGAEDIRFSSSRLAGELTLMATYGRFLFESSVAPVFALIVAGVAYGLVRAPRPTLVAVVPALVYYALVLRVHSTAHLRYQLPLYLLLTWPAARLLADALTMPRRLPRLATQAAAVLVLGYATLQAFSVGTLYNRDPRYAAEDWLRRTAAPGTVVVGIAPDYTLPRFPENVRVARRQVWDYVGTQVGDIRDADAELVVMGLSLARRVQDADKIDRFLRERGYRLAADFKAPLPLFGREIKDLAAINPRVGVFRRESGRAGPPFSSIQGARP
jgi:4-amino-4-deoxy-L-arabinose transferase-like glycosyltransferase